MDRRGFLRGLLGASVIVAAPAVVKASSLMPIFVPKKRLFTFSDSMTIKRGMGRYYSEAIDDGALLLPEHYSVAYNLQAAREDEFGEAFFPTIVVMPDEVGYHNSIKRLRASGDTSFDKFAIRV